MDVDLKKYNSEDYIIIENFLRSAELTEFELNISTLCEAQISKFNISKLSNDPLIDLFMRGGDYRKKLYESIKSKD